VSRPTLSALVVVHDEEEILADCLDRLAFADDIVVVLDGCTDGSKEIAARYTDRLIEGAWPLEGDRRNAGIDFCPGEWIIEVDADEWVTEALAREIRETIAAPQGDIFNIPVHNHVGGKWVRHGWGGNFGKNAYPGLFRKGVKTWGIGRLHPHLTVSGRRGPDMKNAIVHHIDKNISDMLNRLDRYSTARAKDLAETGEIGSLPNMVRKIFSRFLKCYVMRRGYRENGYGIVIALCAALYPVLSHLKARLEEPGR